MKNLTSGVIIMLRQDGSRAVLPPCETPPTLIHYPAEHVGVLGTIEIVRQSFTTVNFHGLELTKEDEPFIVGRDIFDALPPERIEFVTPDYESAIYNGLGIAHVIRCFVAKAGVKVIPHKQPASPEETPINN
jgi:hypothetical protein